MRSAKTFDLASIILIGFIGVLSLIRFNDLPQFIDGYYHLSVANGFLNSGGWLGWAWWDFAPFGRPHLYPPLYHFILAFLQHMGMEAVNSVRITEVFIVPCFFLSMWYVARNLVCERFSFFTLLILSTFFSFYSSVSANVPASLAFILGFFSWLFLKQRKIVSTIICLTFCFYTHAAIPWLFVFSFLFVVFFSKEYRALAVKSLLISIVFFLPFFIHELRYVKYLNIRVLGEAQFIHFSPFIILLGFVSLCVHFREKKFFSFLFLGFMIGSIIVFIKYPYRFFSAQGMVAGAFFCALLIETILTKVHHAQKIIVSIFIIGYLVVSHATIILDKGKPHLAILNSTYYNFITAKIYTQINFQPFFPARWYDSIIDAVKKNSLPNDIVCSNNALVSQFVAAVTNRSCSNSMLWEVKGKENYNYYEYAKLIVWLNDQPVDMALPYMRQWKKEYESEIGCIFRNKTYKQKSVPILASIRFLKIYLVLICFFVIFVIDQMRTIFYRN